MLVNSFLGHKSEVDTFWRSLPSVHFVIIYGESSYHGLRR